MMSDGDFRAMEPEIHKAVYDRTVSMGGSISAEHGIGRLRRGELDTYKSPVALDVMRSIKATLDPNGIMNAAPIRDMKFVIEELIGLDTVNSLPGYEEASSDVTTAILEEAGKLARDVLSPINRNGDREGSRLENGVVITPTGFTDALPGLCRRRLERVAI